MVSRHTLWPSLPVNFHLPSHLPYMPFQRSMPNHIKILSQQKVMRPKHTPKVMASMIAVL